ncbi:MAG: chorismate mutase [Anaerolineae bacterium]
MRCRGVRGATTVEHNTAEAILAATRELLTKMKTRNDFAVEDIASVIFTATPDLDAVYPAVAARELGWTETPLLCVQEMAVSGSLRSCIRVLLHWNTDRDAVDVQHVYLEGARVLRPDLVEDAS